jgi:hypothetical protein
MFILIINQYRLAILKLTKFYIFINFIIISLNSKKFYNLVLEKPKKMKPLFLLKQSKITLENEKIIFSSGLDTSEISPPGFCGDIKRDNILCFITSLI